MSAKKRSEIQAEETTVEVNVFEPQMDRVQADFNLEPLIQVCKEKLAESDKKKIPVGERLVKAREAIARLQNMIAGLETKGKTESGLVWVTMVIRPLVAELQNVFPNAIFEIGRPSGLAGAVTITMSRKGVNQLGKLKGLDCKNITLIPTDDEGLFVRDYSRDTGEYPVGSIGYLNGMNFSTVQVPADKPIQFLLDYLK